MLQPRAKAPSFRLPGLDGKLVSLEEILARGPAVVAFFKVSCPVCQLTFPFLDRMHANGAAGGLQFVGVSQDGAAGTREFNREFGITFPVLLDEASADYAASNGFGISHVPSAFLVETDGVISWALEGFSKHELERLGERAGVQPFRPGDYVPEWKAG
jgi:peroxiredoxin